MSIMLEPPAWLQLPESEPEEFTLEEPQVYWSCYGSDRPIKKKFKWWFSKPEPAVSIYLIIFTTKEEAEADACRYHQTWEWDGKDAHTLTLKEAIKDARRNGNKGVRLERYTKQGWVIAKEWRCDVPLMEGD